MNKQEILQRSRMENQEYGDECQQGLVKGSLIPAFIGLAVVVAFFSFIDLFFLDNHLSSRVFSLGVNVALAAQQWYMFFKTKKKSTLCTAILCVVSSVMMLLVVLNQYIPLIVEQMRSVM